MARMRPMLLEREEETAALAARLAEARAGQGGTVVVEGAPGAGKTALLAQLRADAVTAGGVRVLRAVGGELEREFAFGLVRQLFERVVLTAPADERARLLQGAAARAAPVIGAGDDPGEAVPDAGFATLHGLYWLVAALADDAPLLLIVDDAHWGDAPSLRFLDFLARRAPELAVLLVIGTRVHEPGAEAALLAALADAPGATVLRPGALSAAGVRHLFGDDRVADDVVASALTATGGNPLLVRELVRALAEAGTPPTAEAVRAAVPSSVRRSAARRLARASEAGQLVARALAVVGDRRDVDLLAALCALPAAQAVAALEELRALELVEDHPPRFVHPLLAAAVADHVAPAERDRLHAEAAERLRGRPGTEEEVVVHLLAARPGGRAWAAALLREAGRRAATEGAPDVALRRLRRALEELPAGEAERPALELELGRVAARAGDAAAVAHLETAARADDPAIAATALRDLVAMGSHGPGDDLAPTADALEDALARLGPDADPSLRDDVTAQLLNAVVLDARLAGRRRVLLERVRDGAGPDALSHVVFDQAARDVPAAAVLAVADGVFGHRPFRSLAMIERPSPFWAVVGALAVDGAEVTEAALADAQATVQRTSTRLGSWFVAFMRAEWHLAFGSAALAEDDARRALGLREFALPNNTTLGIASALARALVARGQLDEAEAVVAGFPPEDELEHSWGSVLTTVAVGELRFAQGRHADALAALERNAAMCALYGWERFVLGHLVARRARTLVALGRPDEGRALAEAEVAAARARGVASAEAAALVALAAAQDGEAALATLAAAVAAAERSPAVRVQAEAQLELGAALRRGNQRVEARGHLAIARDLATRCDAAALAARATEELVVAGGRPRRTALSGVAALTPAERRMAEHAASGLTNREIAETLFVTRKTVEFTLGNVYTKLGIRSRTQLPDALA